MWTRSLQVREHELDATGRLSLVSICSLLQEAASNHADELGLSVDRLRRDGLTWVLARMALEIGPRPGKGDAIAVTTWPSGVDGLFATRDFLLVAENETPVVQATSSWMMLDVRRRRPVRLTEEVLSLVPDDAPRALVDDFQRMPVLGRVVDERPMRSGWTDLDVNRHVNHVRYIAWMIDAVPQDLVVSSFPARLDIHFRSELGANVPLIVRTERTAGTTGVLLRQNLVSADSGSAYAEASSLWLPNDL